MKFSKENWKQSEYEKIIKALINGVPSSFAPFSSFNNKENYIHLQTLNDYFNESLENGSEYIVFGSDGGGNPFCINKLNDNQIVLLDFDGEKIVSTNKNINEFLDSIFIYRSFVDVIQSKYGEDALFENLYEDEDIETLKQEFSKLNPKLLVNSEFWKQQIEELIVNKNASS